MYDVKDGRLKMNSQYCGCILFSVLILVYLILFLNIYVKTALSTCPTTLCVDGIIQTTAEGKVNSLSCGLDECA